MFSKPMYSNRIPRRNPRDPKGIMAHANAPWRKCNVCDVSLMSEQAYRNHVEGIMHKKNVVIIQKRDDKIHGKRGGNVNDNAGDWVGPSMEEQMEMEKHHGRDGYNPRSATNASRDQDFPRSGVDYFNSRNNAPDYESKMPRNADQKISADDFSTCITGQDISPGLKDRYSQYCIDQSGKVDFKCNVCMMACHGNYSQERRMNIWLKHMNGKQHATECDDQLLALGEDRFRTKHPGLPVIRLFIKDLNRQDPPRDSHSSRDNMDNRGHSSYGSRNSSFRMSEVEESGNQWTSKNVDDLMGAMLKFTDGSGLSTSSQDSALLKNIADATKMLTDFAQRNSSQSSNDDFKRPLPVSDDDRWSRDAGSNRSDERRGGPSGMDEWSNPNKRMKLSGSDSSYRDDFEQRRFDDLDGGRRDRQGGEPSGNYFGMGENESQRFDDRSRNEPYFNRDDSRIEQRRFDNEQGSDDYFKVYNRDNDRDSRDNQRNDFNRIDDRGGFRDEQNFDDRRNDDRFGFRDDMRRDQDGRGEIRHDQDRKDDRFRGKDEPRRELGRRDEPPRREPDRRDDRREMDRRGDRLGGRGEPRQDRDRRGDRFGGRDEPKRGPDRKGDRFNAMDDSRGGRFDNRDLPDRLDSRRNQGRMDIDDGRDINRRNERDRFEPMPRKDDRGIPPREHLSNVNTRQDQRASRGPVNRDRMDRRDIQDQPDRNRMPRDPGFNSPGGGNRPGQPSDGMSILRQMNAEERKVVSTLANICNEPNDAFVAQAVLTIQRNFPGMWQLFINLLALMANPSVGVNERQLVVGLIRQVFDLVTNTDPNVLSAQMNAVAMQVQQVIQSVQMQNVAVLQNIQTSQQMAMNRGPPLPRREDDFQRRMPSKRDFRGQERHDRPQRGSSRPERRGSRRDRRF